MTLSSLSLNRPIQLERIVSKYLPITYWVTDLIERDVASCGYYHWWCCVNDSKDLTARIKKVAPLAITRHYCIHREQLAKNVKRMAVMDESLQIMNFIKGRLLSARIFKALFEETGSEHTKLIFHTKFVGCRVEKCSLVSLNCTRRLKFICATVTIKLSTCRNAWVTFMACSVGVPGWHL